MNTHTSTVDERGKRPDLRKRRPGAPGWCATRDFEPANAGSDGNRLGDAHAAVGDQAAGHDARQRAIGILGDLGAGRPRAGIALAT